MNEYRQRGNVFRRSPVVGALVFTALVMVLVAGIAYVFLHHASPGASPSAQVSDPAQSDPEQSDPESSEPAESAGDVPSYLLGSWSGSIHQEGVGDYPVQIVLQQGSVGDVIGTSDYPTEGCSGTLTLTNVGEALIDVHEDITENGGKCDPDVDIEIANTEGGLSYAGTADGGFSGHLDAQ